MVTFLADMAYIYRNFPFSDSKKLLAQTLTANGNNNCFGDFYVGNFTDNRVFYFILSFLLYYMSFEKWPGPYISTLHDCGRSMEL